MKSLLSSKARKLALPMICATLLASCTGKQPVSVRSREPVTLPSEGTNVATLEVPFQLQSDEANAALLGRQCAVIWFASESKTLKEEAIENDIRAAPVLAKALGVSYDEQQFRNAFRKTEHKVAGDFDSLFPEMIEKEKNRRIRDVYLFSLWCTASRLWVNLVPLWSKPAEQKAARRWVAFPLAKAQKVASVYDADTAARCEDIGIRSLSDPLDAFDQADQLASEVLELQKTFLLKFMTQTEVEMATQPLLKRRP